MKSIKKMLEHYKLAPRKIWGQNYLINENIRKKIIASLNIKQNEIIWELGPGLGAMTEILLEKGTQVIAFEIDKMYSKILNEKFGEHKNFKLVQGDFLKIFKDTLPKPSQIFSNLPYNIASKVIASITEQDLLREMTFTVQKELAQRMLATPRNKNYSSFTVLVQANFKVIKIIEIGENNFYPVPKVKSTTVKLIPQNRNIKNFKEFNSMVRTVFSGRRKKLKNTIINFLKDSNAMKEDFLKNYLEKRPEEITVDEFIAISNNLITSYH